MKRLERWRGREARLCVEREGDTESESEVEVEDGGSKDEKNQTKIHSGVEEKVDGLSGFSTLS